LGGSLKRLGKLKNSFETVIIPGGKKPALAGLRVLTQEPVVTSGGGNSAGERVA